MWAAAGLPSCLRARRMRRAGSFATIAPPPQVVGGLPLPPKFDVPSGLYMPFWLYMPFFLVVYAVGYIPHSIAKKGIFLKEDGMLQRWYIA